MQVGGEAPELNSSYLLDRAFWDAQLRKYPDGLVVAVPHRRGVVFGPAGNDELLTKLRFTAAALHATGGPNRLSSALYLYKDSRWSVLQAPQTPFE